MHSKTSVIPFKKAAVMGEEKGIATSPEEGLRLLEAFGRIADPAARSALIAAAEKAANKRTKASIVAGT